MKPSEFLLEQEFIIDKEGYLIASNIDINNIIDELDAKFISREIYNKLEEDLKDRELYSINTLNSLWQERTEAIVKEILQLKVNSKSETNIKLEIIELLRGLVIGNIIDGVKNEL